MDSDAVLRAGFVEARSERGGRQRHGAVDSDGVREAKPRRTPHGLRRCPHEDFTLREAKSESGECSGGDRDQGGRERRGAGHEADLSSDTPILQSHIRVTSWEYPSHLLGS
jgi:hypothetical protein